MRENPAADHPTMSSEAEIIVGGTRRILPASWIGAEKPRTGDKLPEGDRGHSVRLIVEGGFSQKQFQALNGSVVALIGTIDRIGQHSISGKFTGPAFDSREPQTLNFPISALRSVQRLAERE